MSTSPEHPAVTIVTPHFPPQVGGVETHVDRVARALSDCGCPVEVLTHRFGHQAPEREAIGGVKVRRFRLLVRSSAFPVSLGLWAHLAWRRRQLAVLHVHQFHAATALGALFVGRSPVVIFTPHYHGRGHTRFAKLLHLAYAPFARLLVRRADKIICVSEAESLVFATRYPGAAAKILVIPNGVDAPRDREPWPVGGRVALVIARLEAYKRVDRIVRASAHLPEGWELVVVGDGSQREALRALASEQSSPVRFVGRINAEDRDRWYATASVVVTMSEHEAFGLTVAEALATGLPVVASDIGAHRDFTRLRGDRVTLVGARDTDADLAAAVVRAGQMGRSQGAIGEVWSWDKVGRSTLAAYLEGTRPRRLAA